MTVYVAINICLFAALGAWAVQVHDYVKEKEECSDVYDN